MNRLACSVILSLHRKNCWIWTMLKLLCWQLWLRRLSHLHLLWNDRMMTLILSYRLCDRRRILHYSDVDSFSLSERIFVTRLLTVIKTYVCLAFLLSRSSFNTVWNCTLFNDSIPIFDGAWSLHLHNLSILVKTSVVYVLRSKKVTRSVLNIGIYTNVCLWSILVFENHFCQSRNGLLLFVCFGLWILFLNVIVHVCQNFNILRRLFLHLWRL